MSAEPRITGREAVSRAMGADGGQPALCTPPRPLATPPMTAPALQTFATAHGAFTRRCNAAGLTISQALILCALPASPEELGTKALVRPDTLKNIINKLRRSGLVKPGAKGVKDVLYERTLSGDTVVAGCLLKRSTKEAAQ